MDKNNFTGIKPNCIVWNSFRGGEYVKVIKRVDRNHFLVNPIENSDDEDAYDAHGYDLTIVTSKEATKLYRERIKELNKLKKEAEDFYKLIGAKV